VFCKKYADTAGPIFDLNSSCDSSTVTASAAHHVTGRIIFHRFEYLSRLSRHRQLIPAFLQFGRVAFSRCHISSRCAHTDLARGHRIATRKDSKDAWRIKRARYPVEERRCVFWSLWRLYRSSLVNVNPAFMDVFLEIYITANISFFYHTWDYRCIYGLSWYRPLEVSDNS
jgi:hypothetical protein